MKPHQLEGALDRLSARVTRIDTEAPAVEATFAAYRDNPRGFVETVLHGTSARRRSNGEAYQFSILDAIASRDHVVVTSGHGVGKSVLAAWATLWFLCSRRDALVLVLAPTQQRQAKGIVEREIKRWAVRGGITLRSDGTALHCDATASRLVLLTNAADVGSLEGQHADHVLLLCDEAKSLDRDVLDGVQGALTGDEGRTVLLSTPGRPAGPHYDAASDQSGTWARFVIGAHDSDRVHPRWVAARAQAWGATSPTYVMRVLGEYPADGEGVLVGWSVLYAASSQRQPLPLSSRDRGTTLALDVARSVAGDHSCGLLVRDGIVLHIDLWREPSLTQTAERALELARRFRPDRIVVDEGGVGGGLVDRLREYGQLVQGLHFGARAYDHTRFQNLRAECYWRLRERLEAGTLCLPSDDDLLAEIAAQRVIFDAKGRIGLAPKDDIRAELGRSPDRADALAMACASSDPKLFIDTPEALVIGDFTFANESWWQSAAGVAHQLGLEPTHADPFETHPAFAIDRAEREAQRQRLLAD